MSKLSSRVVLALVLSVPASTYAQAYPSKPILLIVPSAPGGQPDITARLIANELGKQMGKQVMVDNRGGASGIIGLEVIAKAAPDGYTLGFATFSIMTNPSVFAKLPYDTARDFQSVIQSHKSANLLTVTPSLPEVRTLDESALPGFEVTSWQGVFTTAGTPAPVLARMHAEFVKVVHKPDMKPKLEQQDMEPTGPSAAAFGAAYRSELARWTKVARDVGLKAN